MPQLCKLISRKSEQYPGNILPTKNYYLPSGLVFQNRRKHTPLLMDQADNPKTGSKKTNLKILTITTDNLCRTKINSHNNFCKKWK